MAWDTSTRRARLPKGWARHYRTPVLERDGHRCRIQRPGCTGTATEVDHIKPGDDHSLTNLQAACTWCHRKKTDDEAAAARAATPALTTKRPTESHPGLWA